MTLKEFMLAYKGYSEHNKENIWLTAALNRCDHKKFPTLRQFIGRTKPTKREAEEAEHNKLWFENIKKQWKKK